MPAAGAAVELAALAGPAPASPSKVVRKETATLQVLCCGWAGCWQCVRARRACNACARTRPRPAAASQVRERPRLATGAALQWQQLAALTRKNLTVRCAHGCMHGAAPGACMHGTAASAQPRMCRTCGTLDCRNAPWCAPCRARAWKTNLLLVAQAVLFIALTWGVDRAGGWGFALVRPLHRLRRNSPAWRRGTEQGNSSRADAPGAAREAACNYESS